MSNCPTFPIVPVPAGVTPLSQATCATVEKETGVTCAASSNAASGRSSSKPSLDQLLKSADLTGCLVLAPLETPTNPAMWLCGPSLVPQMLAGGSLVPWASAKASALPPAFSPPALVPTATSVPGTATTAAPTTTSSSSSTAISTTTLPTAFFRRAALASTPTPGATTPAVTACVCPPGTSISATRDVPNSVPALLHGCLTFRSTGAPTSATNGTASVQCHWIADSAQLPLWKLGNVKAVQCGGGDDGAASVDPFAMVEAFGGGAAGSGGSGTTVAGTGGSNGGMSSLTLILAIGGGVVVVALVRFTSFFGLGGHGTHLCRKTIQVAAFVLMRRRRRSHRRNMYGDDLLTSINGGKRISTSRSMPISERTSGHHSNRTSTTLGYTSTAALPHGRPVSIPRSAIPELWSPADTVGTIATPTPSTVVAPTTASAAAAVPVVPGDDDDEDNSLQALADAWEAAFVVVETAAAASVAASSASSASDNGSAPRTPAHQVIFERRAAQSKVMAAVLTEVLARVNGTASTASVTANEVVIRDVEARARRVLARLAAAYPTVRVVTAARGDAVDDTWMRVYQQGTSGGKGTAVVGDVVWPGWVDDGARGAVLLKTRVVVVG
ncbi:hypothetical protein BC828DRAFT_383863 [Blastocladiella britannica]|nr:hypothetical protein BC828DRAFT_383863 [Blastocladiella britannica]